MALFDDHRSDPLNQALTLLNLASPWMGGTTTGRSTSGGLNGGGGSLNTLRKPMNLSVIELPETYQIMVEVPGVTKDNLTISLEEGILTIKAEKKKPDWYPASSDSILVDETFFGKFSRSIRMPNDIDPDNCKAHYESGVLTLAVNKLHRTKARKIEIGGDEASEQSGNQTKGGTEGSTQVTSKGSSQ